MQIHSNTCISFFEIIHEIYIKQGKKDEPCTL